MLAASPHTTTQTVYRRVLRATCSLLQPCSRPAIKQEPRKRHAPLLKCLRAASLLTSQHEPDLAQTESQDEDDWLQRTQLLVGSDKIARLAATNVLLVGLGEQHQVCPDDFI
eukprot:jgi/Chrzof1/2048/Cz11g01010.t1